MEEQENLVENNVMINDIREPAEFKGYSFSNYKKVEVKKQFLNEMLKGKIEPACYWCAELICSGHYMDIWEIILYYIGKHIHTGNPKLIIYLEIRYNLFRSIMQKGFYINELQLRNNRTIRDLFAEVITVLTISNKKHSFETIKINRVEEFDMTHMTDRLKATTMVITEDIFQKEDPKELYIAMNEFTYHISNLSSNMHSACYWIEWTFEFDAICRKRKETLYCKRRTQYKVDNCFQCDIIWIIWDILLFYSKTIQNPYIEKIMNSIMNLFCIKYTNATGKKRRYLLYYAVEILTEPITQNGEIVSDKEIIKVVMSKIGEIYKQIKKKEISPNTDYLFNNFDTKNNFENSVKKMEMMSNADFIPRLSG